MAKSPGRAGGRDPGPARGHCRCDHRRGDSGREDGGRFPAGLLAAGQRPGPQPGNPVLYAAPLKALINDQYDRLSGLCDRLEIPVTTKLVEDAEPLRIRVGAAGRLPKPSDLLMDQMRAIDNGRLVKGPLLRSEERRV